MRLYVIDNADNTPPYACEIPVILHVRNRQSRRGLDERTRIDDDHFSSASRHDFLQEPERHQKNRRQGMSTNLEVGGVSDDEPPNSNIFHHQIRPVTEPAFDTLVLIQRPTTVPQWSISSVQPVLLVRRRLR